MYKILFFITFSIFTLLTVGCGGNPPGANNNNTGNVKPPNSNGPANGLTVTPKPVTAKENDAPTLAPVVQSYYEALKKKDDALLKSVLSASFIKEIEQGMKEEKKTGMAAYMAETDRTEPAVEVRNEKITGDKGTAELKGGSYVNWSTINFINEGGKWKLTNSSSEIDAVKPTGPPPTNTAK
jgi:nitrogen fixation protein